MTLGKLRLESKYLAISYYYEKERWSINWMCRQLNIARASYYKWKNRIIPKHEQEALALAEIIKEYHERFSGILGYRRMTEWINHFNQKNYSKNRIHRIMKKIGIHSVIRKARKTYKKSTAEQKAKNVLARDFYAAAPNQKWATDVTEFKIPGTGNKIYLSVILDLYDRYPVAYVVRKRNDNKLVFDTFGKAIAAYPDAKPMFHSDRGFQYTSRLFHDKLAKQAMTQSMSRVAHCIDNGPTEGFWGIMKTEMYAMHEITDEKSLREAIEQYMHFYTFERLQSRYACNTPAEVRDAALKTTKPKQYPIPENKRINKYKAKLQALKNDHTKSVVA